MEIDLSFKHMKASEEIRDHAIEKSERLKRFFDGKIHVTWTFSVEKKNLIAHCHLLGNHMDYFGEDTSTVHFFEAIDKVLDHIERQVKKHKEKVTEHHKHTPK